MSEWATALKIGTTALVLDLIERGAAPQLEIAQPVDATKSISRDQTYDWIIELTDGRKISAIDVQRIYLAAATKAVTQEQDKEVAWRMSVPFARAKFWQQNDQQQVFPFTDLRCNTLPKRIKKASRAGFPRRAPGQ